jgi:hypothetical protein
MDFDIQNTIDWLNQQIKYYDCYEMTERDQYWFMQGKKEAYSDVLQIIYYKLSPPYPYLED